MKKIRLNLDDLKVESFVTTPESEGVVKGYSCPTCDGPTCAATCPATCPQTCDTCPWSECSCPPISCLGSSGGHACA
jgi:hypothetical protein